MSRYGYGGRSLRSFASVGSEALKRADDALAAGDKLGAIRAYGQAYDCWRESRADDAKSKKARALAAIETILAEVGPGAFGPLLCDHGTGKNFACWVCQDRKLSQQGGAAVARGDWDAEVGGSNPPLATTGNAIQQDGAAAAREAHNLEVDGSIPSPATQQKGDAHALANTAGNQKSVNACGLRPFTTNADHESKGGSEGSEQSDAEPPTLRTGALARTAPSDLDLLAEMVEARGPLSETIARADAKKGRTG